MQNIPASTLRLTFDYASAMKRVSNELDSLVAELWPDFEQAYGKVYSYQPPKPRSQDDKVQAMRCSPQFVSDKIGFKKLSMLQELRQGCYYHANDNFSELVPKLGKDADFYARLMIEQAKREPGRKFGWAWMIRENKAERLANAVYPGLLKAATRIGFWWLANEYLASESNPPDEFYNSLMEQPTLDLATIAQLDKKPVMRAKRGIWPDFAYIRAVERARLKPIPQEDKALLVRPIVERIIHDAFGDESGVEDTGNYLARELKPYQEFLEMPTIQGLLRALAIGKLETACSWDTERWRPIGDITELRPYLRIGDAGFVKLVSTKVEATEIDDPKSFVSEFPGEWLTSEARAVVTSQLETSLDDPQTFRNSTEIFPAMAYINSAYRRGYLERDNVNSRMQAGLGAYLTRRAAPSGQAVAFLLNSLDRSIVEKELYQKVVRKGIADLKTRKKEKEAEKWKARAKEEGWLET